jgi:hypothetical protein
MLFPAGSLGGTLRGTLKQERTMHTNQNTETKNLEGAIWGRLIGPDKPTLSPETARSILELEFPEEDKARMHELAAKARAGTLRPEEQEEIETYSRIGSVLGIMKSKARMTLKKAKKATGTGR